MGKVRQPGKQVILPLIQLLLDDFKFAQLCYYKSGGLYKLFVLIQIEVTFRLHVNSKYIYMPIQPRKIKLLCEDKIFNQCICLIQRGLRYKEHMIFTAMRRESLAAHSPAFIGCRLVCLCKVVSCVPPPPRRVTLRNKKQNKNIGHDTHMHDHPKRQHLYKDST